MKTLDLVYDALQDKWVYAQGMTGYNIPADRTDDGKDCFMWDTGSEPNFRLRYDSTALPHKKKEENNE